MADYKRQTAKKCRIGHLLSGNYVQKEGWEPSYVETEVGRVSRVNVIGIVVSNEGNSLTIDDGSGKISLRTFGEIPLEGYDVGDKVLIIARPRVYNNEMYLAGEIVKRIKDDKWLEHRKLEVKLTPKVKVEKKEPEQTQEVVEETVTEQPKTTNKSEELMEKIKDLDGGDGAEIEDVVKDIEGGEKMIRRLMEEGEVFEITPGKVKVLE